MGVCESGACVGALAALLGQPHVAAHVSALGGAAFEPGRHVLGLHYVSCACCKAPVLGCAMRGGAGFKRGSSRF